MKLTLRSPVSEAKGVGPAYAQILFRKGVHRVGDLLLHFPDFYLDTATPCPVIRPGEPQLYRVKLGAVKVSRLFARRLSLVRVEGTVGRKKVSLVFFNQPYLAEGLKNRESLLVFGRCEKRGQDLQIVNPKLIPPEFVNRILPVYQALGTLKSGRLRSLIAAILDDLRDDEEVLPAEIARRYAFPAAVEAFSAVHRPPHLPADNGASEKRRFVFSEFFLYHLELQAVRAHFRSRPRPRRYSFSRELRLEIDRSLPFALTPGQIKAFEEIVGDLMSPQAMTRLLQGEVGSGKTIVAFLALLVAVQNGFQGAFLAPTEILAGQHLANARAFFLQTPPALLTGATPQAERQRIERGLEGGEIGIVFGTHALLQEQIHFRNLALVVIDEQHRFGVAQRAALFCKGKGVDLLATTATPIPRTLQLACYRDMAVSVLKRDPVRSAAIKTRVIAAAKRDDFYRWLTKSIKKGAKGYIVMPLIESSEFFSGQRSLEEEKPFFQSLLHGIPWTTLTGRSEAADKHATLQNLKKGAIQVLVATSVIEVGIDVADATFIVIENADRYGLAQLHQMRGRVGRGASPAHCFLISSPRPSAGGRRRLETMLQTQDGFRIAELDLEMRGGGRIAGQEQYGTSIFRCGDPGEDLELFFAAEKEAGQALRRPQCFTPAMREVLTAVERKIKSLSFS